MPSYPISCQFQPEGFHCLPVPSSLYLSLASLPLDSLHFRRHDSTCFLEDLMTQQDREVQICTLQSSMTSRPAVALQKYSVSPGGVYDANTKLYMAFTGQALF